VNPSVMLNLGQDDISRPFWACAKDGIVQAGTGKDPTDAGSVFISYTDPDPYNVMFAAVSTGPWGNSQGVWNVCVDNDGDTLAGNLASYQFNGNYDDTVGVNHGTLTGTVSFTADHLGNSDAAVIFSGAAGNFVTISTPFQNAGGEFSISTYLNPSVVGDGSWHGFVGYQDGGVCPGRSPSMWVNKEDGLHFDSCSSGVRSAGDAPSFFTAGTYTHVAWVKSGTDYIFYKNGVASYTMPGAPATVDLSQDYWLGRVDNYYAGTMDEIQVRVLS
jgi:hypothetical protein